MRSDAREQAMVQRPKGQSPQAGPARAEAPAPGGRRRRRLPLWHERSTAGKLLFGIIGPIGAGIGAAVLLGISPLLFWITLAAGLGAAFMGSLEHTNIGHGGLRAMVGGGSFGLALVIAHELIGTERTVKLPEPVFLLPVLTAVGSVPLGAAAGLLRSSRERATVQRPQGESPEAGPAQAGAPAPGGRRRRPPLWHERSTAGKLLFGIIGPIGAGIGTAVLLGISPLLFLIALAAGLGAAFLGSLEHTDIGHGGLRAMVGGGSFGLTLVIAHELIGTERTVELPEPAFLFPIFTGVGAVPLGAAAALLRRSREGLDVPKGDVSLFKLALIAVFISGPLAVFAQVLHPLPEPGDTNPVAFLETIAPSGEWIAIHLISILSYIAGVPAFVALWQVHRPGPPRVLAMLAFVIAMVLTAVGLVWVAVDGFAIKDTGDLWAASTGERRIAVEEAAIALEEVILAFFSLEVFAFFGIVFGVFALSFLQAGIGPRWVHLGAILFACVNVFAGTVQAFTDRTEFFTHILVPIGVVGVSAWYPTAVVLAYQHVKSRGVPEPVYAAGLAARTPGGGGS